MTESFNEEVKAFRKACDEPHAIGKKKDDEVRGRRFVDRFVVEAE